MAVEFKESRTRENLMRAFAGESQARNRYTIAAETAREQGLFAISQIFLFTADQERAHAARFYDLLKNLNGTTIAIDGSYPVDQFDNVAELLRAAQHNEMEEAGDVYQAFGKTAREEGFLEVSSAFIQIARIEAVHGKRFGKLAELLDAATFTMGRWRPRRARCAATPEDISFRPVWPPIWMRNSWNKNEVEDGRAEDGKSFESGA